MFHLVPIGSRWKTFVQSLNGLWVERSSKLINGLAHHQIHTKLTISKLVMEQLSGHLGLRRERVSVERAVLQALEPTRPGPVSKWLILSFTWASKSRSWKILQTYQVLDPTILWIISRKKRARNTRWKWNLAVVWWWTRVMCLVQVITKSCTKRVKVHPNLVSALALGTLERAWN